MTFLNSIYLAALAAIVIPLLIHFLSRRRIKIIDFSSLKFLFQMQKTRLRWLKIRDLILLLLRMLVLALLALAFARPALTGKHGSSHAPTSVILLLDNSPSTERLSSSGILYDDIKQGALQIMGLLNANDDVALITLSGRPTVYGPFSDLGRARDALYATAPGPATPAIRDGLQKAGEILAASHNLNREIYVLSDLQNGPWWESSYARAIDTAYHYFVIAYNEDGFDNIGLTSVQFPPQLLAPGEEFSISANLDNYSEKAVDGRLVELYLDNVKKAQTAIDLKPHGAAAAQFSVASAGPGHHRGYIELEDDDYAPDNKFYFDFEIPAKISVLAVAEIPEDLRTLANCLERTNIGYIEYKGIGLGEFSRQNLRSYNVIILDNISGIPQSYQNSLDDFLANGGGLFVVMGSRAQLEPYRTFLDNRGGIKPGERVVAGAPGANQTYFELNSFDLTHPIFKIYSPQGQESLEIPPLKVLSFVSLSGGQALASTGDKRTILTQSKDAKIIVFGSGFDAASSDMAVHSFIVPFVIRTVEYLASEISPTQEYFLAGKPATINLPGRTQAVAIRLTGPSSDITLPVSRGAYGPFVNLPEVGFPGFYTLTADFDTLGFMSVNHDSTESSPQMITPDRLREIIGKDLTYLEGKSDIKTEITQAKFGLELWKYCLALALILLIIESILVRAPKHRAA